MSVSRINREIPQNISEECKELQIQGLAQLYREEYQSSRRVFDELLQLLSDAQDKENRPIHKGMPLYNIGIASIGSGDFQNGLYSILLAYIEDTLNHDFDREDEADRCPAGRYLSDIFIIELRFLRDIKRRSWQTKERGEWNLARKPEVILEDVMSSYSIARRDLLSLCKRQNPRLGLMTLGFPQPREKRVFIGTNYDTFSHVIPEIKLAVMFRNYMPIIIREVNVREEEMHDVSLLLLHTCGHAIFDITDPAGQLMEIERARDYGVRVLLLRSQPTGHELYVSQMIRSLGYEVQTYRHTRELVEHVTKFLP